MHADFVHLHQHTQYSLLESTCVISELVKLASFMKMPALAMTDNGNMFGTIEFYKACLKAGIKPIIGYDAYVAPGSRFDKSSGKAVDAAHRLVLLARDESGYRNLLKLATIASLEGFYYKPRIDKDALAQHAEGLIGLSGGLRSEIASQILAGQLRLAEQTTDEYRQILGPDHFYLELQDHGIERQGQVNDGLLAVSKRLGVPVAATNNVQYLRQQDAPAHDALLCIQLQTTLDDPNRRKLASDQMYFKSPEEMKQLFGHLPEAIKNTINIAERCNLELDFDARHLPSYTPPAGMTREAFLQQLCDEGLKKRYGVPPADVLDRLRHELRIVRDMGFVSYFLIVWDFIHYAKQKGIPVGPGRGSAAGSLISYLLGITDIDPLRYELLFERFLNPERISMPDIDIDFCYERRGEVIEYVVKKYGVDNVAQIITFGTLQAKGAIRDVGRVMNLPYGEVDKIAKLVPNELNITLTKSLEQEPELKRLYESDHAVRQLLDMSMAVEGLARHASTHAAGVVISEDPLVNHVPLVRLGDGQLTTGFAMGALESIGLLKMDFLGLRTLTVIQEALNLIRQTRNETLEMDRLPLDDPPTFELLGRADTIGIFQLESSGMRDLLRKLQPTVFEDLIALLALYRPGPIGSGMLDDFIKRKHGQVTVTYDHPSLEPVLKETYGIMVYQEQVMRIANVMAGFTLAQADLLRRAMGKKIPEVMEQQRKAFIDGCASRGIHARIAEKVFGLIEYFSGYGFNKSHSTAYAMISYQTAFLKANYPVEFMTSLLTSERQNTDKLVQYISECAKMGIRVLPPDVNESVAQFSVEGPEAIRFGLGAVKNVGEGAIEELVVARKRGGRFASLADVSKTVDTRQMNRKVFESLIKCGAMDSLGGTRAQLLAGLDRVLEAAGSLHKDRQLGQMSFFDMGEGSAFHTNDPELPDVEDWPETERLAYEKELLGFYVTGHPLRKYAETLRAFATCRVSEIGQQQDQSAVSVGGVVAKCRLTSTKKTGERMAILELEEEGASVEALVFPESYKSSAGACRAGQVVFVSGRVSLREESPKLIVDEVIPIDEAQCRLTAAVQIDLRNREVDEQFRDRLQKLLGTFPGSVPVYLHVNVQPLKSINILLGKEFRVSPTEAMMEQLDELCGRGNVHLLGRGSSLGLVYS